MTMFCVQYDDLGNITSTWSGGEDIPECANQLVFQEWVPTDGMKVDIETKELVPYQLPIVGEE